MSDLGLKLRPPHKSDAHHAPHFLLIEFCTCPSRPKWRNSIQCHLPSNAKVCVSWAHLCVRMRDTFVFFWVEMQFKEIGGNKETWSEYKQNIITSFDKKNYRILMRNLTQSGLSRKGNLFAEATGKPHCCCPSFRSCWSRKSVLPVCISWLCFPLYQPYSQTGSPLPTVGRTWQQWLWA